jgi:hypothetical protein
VIGDLAVIGSARSVRRRWIAPQLTTSAGAANSVRAWSTRARCAVLERAGTAHRERTTRRHRCGELYRSTSGFERQPGHARTGRGGITELTQVPIDREPQVYNNSSPWEDHHATP